MSFRSNRLLRFACVGVTTNGPAVGPPARGIASPKRALISGRCAQICRGACAGFAEPAAAVFAPSGPRRVPPCLLGIVSLALLFLALPLAVAAPRLPEGCGAGACKTQSRKTQGRGWPRWSALAIAGWCRRAAMLPWRPDILEWRNAPLRWLARLAIGLLCFSATAAVAQPYPDRPVQVVVGFAAGGPTDVIARIVCDKFSTRVGKQFYVVNQPGAGSNTARALVAASPPDASALSVVSTGFAVNPSLFAKVPYDPIKDFAPISIVAVSPNVVSVHPSVPAKTMQELIEVIKANPGKYSFAAPGVGSTPHLSGEIFRLSNDLDLPTVQFTGAAPAIQSTVGGHTPVAFSAVP